VLQEAAFFENLRSVRRSTARIAGAARIARIARRARITRIASRTRVTGIARAAGCYNDGLLSSRDGGGKEGGAGGHGHNRHSYDGFFQHCFNISFYFTFGSTGLIESAYAGIQNLDSKC